MFLKFIAICLGFYFLKLLITDKIPSNWSYIKLFFMNKYVFYGPVSNSTDLPWDLCTLSITGLSDRNTI